MRIKTAPTVVTLIAVALVAAGLFFVTLFAVHFKYVNFPSGSISYLEGMIADGQALKCEDGLPGGRVQWERYDQCFGRAVFESALIEEYDRPEQDMAYLYFTCSHEDFALRFQIVTGRTDEHLWCDRKIAPSLSELEAFTRQEAVYIPDEPGYLERRYLKLRELMDLPRRPRAAIGESLWGRFYR